jgi:hypothetical protein
MMKTYRKSRRKKSQDGDLGANSRRKKVEKLGNVERNTTSRLGDLGNWT